MKYSTIWINLVWLIIWQIIYSLIGNDLLVPSPISTFKALGGLITSSNFYFDIGLTFYRVVISLGLSMILGVGTALMAHFIKGIEAFLKPFMRVLKVTPVMAVIILALLWFESGNIPIFVSILMGYPIIYTNTLMGLKTVDKQLIEMAEVFHVKWQQRINKIYIPHMQSYLEAALRLMTGIAWKVIIAAEVLAVPTYSMGYNLLNAKVYMESEQLFAWIIVIIVLSSLCEKGLDLVLGRRRRHTYDPS